MGLEINIYGTLVDVSDSTTGKVENWGTEIPSEQYWHRYELPVFFEIVEYDKDGNVLLTVEQEEYAKEEVRRCKQGFYFMNNGVLTYITGKHYFYLQWWKLEDDIYPDYRDTDRRYFLFLNYWEQVLWCLGIVRGKKRREGASSQATSNLIYECIFFKNSICGLVSKTDTDGKKTFSNMVAFGYRMLPVFLKPSQLNNKDSVSELVFAHKTVSTKDGKGRTINNDTGHRSSVDFRAPGKNAYDSGRLSRGLFDEGGKWAVENPFSTFIGIVSKTMVKGAKRVGFMECPSTINEMTKSGGAEYKKVWNNADQFKHTRTPNRLVRYFTPAYDGYLGFIDRYGMSVIDAPNEYQYKYLVDNFVGIGDLTEEDIRLGAKKYLESKREPLEGTDLEEEIRMNPFDEKEMFLYAGFGCAFNAVNIQSQINELEQTPVFLRQIRTIEKIIKKPDLFGKIIEREEVSMMDDKLKGGLFVLEKPNKENNWRERGGIFEPLNTSMYQIGVDTTQNERIAINGSHPRIIVFKKSCIVDGKEMGLYPVAMWISPTRLDIHFDEEVLKLCKWYGCRANYENDRRTDFISYFKRQNCERFLTWTPTIFRNPAKRGGFKVEIGSRSGDPFQLAQQLQILKKYIDGDDNEGYNGHVQKIMFPTLLKQLLEYDHLDRTKSDEVVALAMCLAPVLGEMENPIKPQRTKPILQTYELKWK